MSARAAFYIDGFNLYHAIDDLKKPHLKWFDLRDYAEFIAKKNNETVVKVNYFSALAKHKPEGIKRHQTYIRALVANSVTYNLGNFKKKQRSCRECNATWTQHEEKETDVNLAISLIQDGMDNIADVFYVISGDTDFAPAVKLLKVRYPNIQYVPIFPPKRNRAKELMNLCSSSRQHIDMTETNIAKSRLPECITDINGTFHCPDEYALPKEGIIH